MILVSLGTMDMRAHTAAVNLDRIPMENAHSTQLDTALSLVVSANGAHGEPEVIDLPVHDNISTEPIVFHAADATKVRLLFDLIQFSTKNFINKFFFPILELVPQ
jgi:glycerophosphodiester phosphodiesterase